MASLYLELCTYIPEVLVNDHDQQNCGTMAPSYSMIHYYSKHLAAVAGGDLQLACTICLSLLSSGMYTTLVACSTNFQQAYT